MVCGGGFKLLICSVCVALAGFAFYKYIDIESIDGLYGSNSLKCIIQAWERNIHPPGADGFSSVLIGLNGNVDLIVDGVPVLKELKFLPSGTSTDRKVLDDLNQLEEAFTMSLKGGSGMERPFSQDEPFQQLTEASSTSAGAQWFIGGNAGLMAQKIATTFPNVEVNLVAPVGPRLKDLLHSSIKYSSGCKKTKDEVHIIMEYKVGEHWGADTARVANRFITSYDMTNSRLELMAELFSTVQRVNPQLIIVSGLHMVESQPPQLREEKLLALKKYLSGMPDSIAVHLELASMSDMGFVKDICLQLLEQITSLGLNEQELSFTTQALGRNGSLGEGRHPSTLRVTEMMTGLMDQFGYHEATNPKSQLTRIHFHSLTFHMVVATDPWSNLESSVAAGTRIAGKQACDQDILDPSMVELRIPGPILHLSNENDPVTFNSSAPVTSWIEKGRQFVYSPVLVCKVPLKTVGLGDAISATGLLFSEYTL